MKRASDMSKHPAYYTYPAFFSYDEDGISVEFPDLPGCLPCGHTSEEAFKRAREALGLHLFGMEQEGMDVPAPTPVRDLHPAEGAVVAMVEVYMPAVRMAAVNSSVTRTVTLPAWMNAAAKERNINFSQVLQEALRKQLRA